jgi:hypothetical protein
MVCITKNIKEGKMSNYFKILQTKIKKRRETELNFYFEEALKHPHSRIEFIRHDKGKQPRQKRGVMFSAIDPTDIKKVIVGFSLCHVRFDDFDKINWGTVKQKDFGKKVAYRRALKWKDRVEALVYSEKLEENFPTTVYIPQTVHKSLAKFVQGCYKYYKNKIFPVWVDHYFLSEKLDMKGE